MIRQKVCGAFAVGALAITAAGAASAADVQVDPATKYQTISGWETMLRSWEIDKANNKYDSSWAKQAPKVLDRLVNELGINRVRLEYRSGYENPTDYWAQFVTGGVSYTELRSHWYEKINDNADPKTVNLAGFQFTEFDYLVETYLLPIKKLVEANGEKLYINVCYVDFNATMKPGTLEHALAPAEYAELTQVMFDHLHTKYKLDPDGFEVILEPELTDQWRGKQIAEGMIAATDALKAAGYTPKVSAPSTTSQAEVLNYFNEILKVSGAAERMTTLSYHRYTLGDPAAIWATAKAHGLQTAMLEHTDGNIDGLLDELTLANISAWQKFGVAVLPTGADNSYYRADLTDPNNPAVTLGPAALLLAPVFRFVRNGAQRIGAASTDTNGFRPVAFVNTNGSHVVVGKVGTAGTVNVSGLPAATYGVRIAANGALTDGKDIVSQGGVVSVTAPVGVLAIYDKKALAGAVPGSGGSSGSGGSNGASGANGSSGANGTGGATNGTGGTKSGTAGGNQKGGNAGTDAAGAGEDAGAGAGSVARAAASNEDSGCGCRVGASSTHERQFWLISLVVAVGGLLGRRRVPRA